MDKAPPQKRLPNEVELAIDGAVNARMEMDELQKNGRGRFTDFDDRCDRLSVAILDACDAVDTACKKHGVNQSEAYEIRDDRIETRRSNARQA